MKNLITNRSAAIAITACIGLYVAAAQSADYADIKIGPTFNDKGQLEQPKNFRQWVFLGAPLTPQGLNDGKAGFPEFHNVYVEPAAFEHYRKNKKLGLLQLRPPRASILRSLYRGAERGVRRLPYR